MLRCSSKTPSDRLLQYAWVALFAFASDATATTYFAVNSGLWNDDSTTQTWADDGCGGGHFVDGPSNGLGHHVHICPGVSIDTPEGVNIGASASPFDGTFEVEGNLNVEHGQFIYYHGSARISFESGSGGSWRGTELTTVAVPDQLDFSSPTEIGFDFSNYVNPDGQGADELSLPWNLCTSSCSSDDIQLGTATRAPTLIRLGFESYPGQDATILTPGIFLEVDHFEDSDGNATDDTIVVRLPTTGPDHGKRFFGCGEADCAGIFEPGSTGSRNPEALDCGGSPCGDGDDTSGRSLRNAIGEAQWTLAPTPARIAPGPGGSWRYEIQIDPSEAPFDSETEFVGFAACLPLDQTTYASGSEVDCVRVIRSLPDGHSATGETLVSFSRPAGAWLQSGGDRLNLYAVRPVPGQQLTPVNPVRFEGGSVGAIRAEQGSLFAAADPLLGVHFVEAGPGGSGGGVLNLHNLHNDDPEPSCNQLLYFEHFGGTLDDPNRPGATAAINLNSQYSPVTDLHFRNWCIDRSQFGFPDSNTNLANAQSSPIVGATAKARNRTDTIHDNPLDSWTNISFREIRCHGVSSCLQTVSGGMFEQCPDDLLYQKAIDVLWQPIVDHDPDDGATNSERGGNWDSFEFGGNRPTCNVDGVIAMPYTGTGILPRCKDCEPYETWHVANSVAIGIDYRVAKYGLGGGGHPISEDEPEVDHNIGYINSAADMSVWDRASYAYTALHGWWADPKSSARGQFAGLKLCNDNVGQLSHGCVDDSATFKLCDSDVGIRLQDTVMWNCEDKTKAQFYRSDEEESEPKSFSFGPALLHFGENGNARLRLFTLWEDSDWNVEINNLQVMGPTSALADHLWISFHSDGVDDFELGPNIHTSGNVQCGSTGAGAVFVLEVDDENWCRTRSEVTPDQSDGPGVASWDDSLRDLIGGGGTGALDPPYGFEIRAPQANQSTHCATHPDECDLANARPAWAGLITTEPWAYGWLGCIEREDCAHLTYRTAAADLSPLPAWYRRLYPNAGRVSTEPVPALPRFGALLLAMLLTATATWTAIRRLHAKRWAHRR